MPNLNKREALRGVTHTRTMSLSRDMINANEDNDTMSFVFISDDNAGQRYSWSEDSYYSEKLDVNGANAEKLNTFFKNHSRSVDSAIGKVTNAHVEGSQYVGDVTFGSDAESQVIAQKYREGILTDVSIGYEIIDYEVTRGAENEQDVVTVTNFNIFEVSAVGIGFDSGATKRDKDDIDRSPKMDEKQLERLKLLEAMSKRNEDEGKEFRSLLTAQKDAFDAERKALDLEKIEMKREREVGCTVADFGQRGVDALASFGDTKPTDNELRAKILSAFAGDAKDVTPLVDAKATRGAMVDAMVDGLAIRAGANIEKPAEGYARYMYEPLTSLARELMGDSARGLAPMEVAERSLVTGDFPLLLQSVGARVLVAEFESQVGTYKTWMKEVDVPDFRIMQDLTNSFGGGRLTKTKENGDLKEIDGSEAKEEWKIETFGNKFVLTREMIINDDLGAFTALISTFGEMASTTANGIAYDILQRVGDFSAYKMADGKSYYDASRNNTTTAVLSSEALSAGKLAMSKHKKLDGKTLARVMPKYLVVSPALEVKALEILGALSKEGADNVNVPNVNKNAYVIVVEPEIVSDTAWFLLSERRTFKMGFLAGTGRTPTIKKNDSSVLRTVFEGIFDIGAMCEDYRGLYKSTGTV